MIIVTLAFSLLFLNTVLASEASKVKPTTNFNHLAPDAIKTLLGFAPELSFPLLEAFPYFRSLQSHPHPLQLQLAESLGLKSLVSMVPYHRDLAALGGVTYGAAVQAEKLVHVSKVLESSLKFSPIRQHLLLALAEEILEYRKEVPVLDPKLTDISHLFNWESITLALLTAKKYEKVIQLAGYFPDHMKNVNTLLDTPEKVALISTALIECPECFQYIFQNINGLANILCFADCPFEILDGLIQNTQVDLLEVSRKAWNLIALMVAESRFDSMSDPLEREAFLRSRLGHFHPAHWNYSSKIMQAVFGEGSDVNELLAIFDDRDDIYRFCRVLAAAGKFELAFSLVQHVSSHHFVVLAATSRPFAESIVQNHPEFLMELKRKNPSFDRHCVVIDFKSFFSGKESLRDYIPICKPENLETMAWTLLRSGLVDELRLLLQRPEVTLNMHVEMMEAEFGLMDIPRKQEYATYGVVLDSWQRKGYRHEGIISVPFEKYVNLYLDPHTADLMLALNNNSLFIRAKLYNCEPVLADNHKYRQLLDIIGKNPLLEHNVFDMQNTESISLANFSPKLLERLEVLIGGNRLTDLVFNYLKTRNPPATSGDMLIFIAQNYSLMSLYFKLCPSILAREIKRLRDPEAYAARLAELEDKRYYNVYLELCKFAKSPDGPGKSLVFDSVIHAFFLQFIEVMP